MKKVLQINAGSKIFGGVEAFLLNFYRCIDYNKLSFDFLTLGESTYDDYLGELKKRNAECYSFNLKSTTLIGKLKVFIYLLKFLHAHHYDVIDINTGAKTTQIVCLLAAVLNNVKVRISHCHSQGEINILGKVESILICLMSNKYLACSNRSAEYMFGEKNVKSNRVKIINNAIDTDKFRYNLSVRNLYREKLCIEKDTFVIGNVGRFQSVKNHRFMLEVLKEMSAISLNVRLVLVGEGELLNDIKEYAKELHIEKMIIFLGKRLDVNNIYQIFDAFILTSFREGLPLVGIEAQISGLPCYVTDTITRELNILGKTTFISLDSPQKWATNIYQDFCKKRYSTRELSDDDIKNTGYNIGIESEKYKNILEGCFEQ